MKIGKNSFVSPKASIYGNVEIGDNVRIDDFCILTGNIHIGNNIHIACFSFMSGGYGIELHDFSQFAPRTTILSGSDDYKGYSLVGPQIPDDFKPRLETGKVIIGRHTLLGVNCTILPNVTIGEGCSVGAYSLIKRGLEPWGIYTGVPAKRLGDRSQEMLKLEKEFIQWQQQEA